MMRLWGDSPSCFDTVSNKSFAFNYDKNFNLEDAKMIVIVSNRNINPDKDDHEMFGDSFNKDGQDFLRIATANNLGVDKWKLTLLDEPKNFDDLNPPSRAFFKQCLNETKDSKKPWVFFVHGFNQSFLKNLNKCKEIEEYGVNVVAFSWPSNPGPQAIYKKLKEYKRSRKNARRSVIGLERTLEKLSAYMGEYANNSCDVNFNMVVHSLGNYLFKCFVESDVFSGETGIFNNVILHEADCDNRDHSRWVERIRDAGRVYITINKRDKVLNLSDKVNADRLGNTVRELNAGNASYLDFTGVKGVGKSHRLWHKPATKNVKIHTIFEQLFSGERPEQAGDLSYDHNDNTYRLS